jgi:NAD(P)-dependent dehydrogenase (short-subunit alcohol dehydrogenase family)
VAGSSRAALVTGGTGRVGAAIAERLEEEGFRVFAAGRRDGDVARADEARALAERAATELRGLDLLVNAAGEGFDPRPFEDVSEADWDAAFGATAKGSFFVTQAAAPFLRRSEAGLVVMIEDVARALAPDVRVCGIAPGPVAVEPDQEERRAAETLLGRTGSPADVAGAVIYLAGASFVTGTTLVVDGGRLLA